MENTEQPIHPNTSKGVARIPRFALPVLAVLLAIYFDLGRLSGVFIGLAFVALVIGARWWTSYKARLKRLFKNGRTPSPDELFAVLKLDPVREFESVFDRYSLGLLTPRELRAEVAKQVPSTEDKERDVAPTSGVSLGSLFSTIATPLFDPSR